MCVRRLKCCLFYLVVGKDGVRDGVVGMKDLRFLNFSKKLFFFFSVFFFKDVGLRDFFVFIVNMLVLGG